MATKIIESRPQKKPKLQILPKILNGGLAGMIGVSMVFPIDLVKTRLQTQPVGPNGELQYKNMRDCFKKTYAAEGFFGLYRGASVNITLITPEKAIKLASNDVFRHHLADKHGYLPITHQMLAGGMAGACQIVITTPMELLKIRMQDAGRIVAEAKKAGKVLTPPSAIQLIRQVIARHGVLGLYKGLQATGLRDVSFSVVYFPAFSIFHNMWPRSANSTRPPFWWSFISGCLAGTLAAIFVNPLDVVKTRLQTIGGSKYKSVFDCVMKTLKNEGPYAFLKGTSCRIMVVAPLFGIAQTVYFLGVFERLLGYELVRSI